MGLLIWGFGYSGVLVFWCSGSFSDLVLVQASAALSREGEPEHQNTRTPEHHTCLGIIPCAVSIDLMTGSQR
jgi:hypothetical protein